MPKLTLREQLEILIEEADKTKFLNEVTEYGTFEVFMDEITKLESKDDQTKLKAIKAWVQKIDRENQKLRNGFKQALNADLIERRRYLRYRIYTAGGIASVILLTGYLAQVWEIPLPLLRIGT